MIQGSPRTFRDNRPDRYVKVELEGSAPFWFRLPNERRQMILLCFVARRVKGGGRSPLAIVGSLNALAAVVGTCWFHRVFRLEVPSPWAEVEAAGTRARVDARESFEVPEFPGIEREKGESKKEFEIRLGDATEDFNEVIEDSFEAHLTAAEDAAIDRVLAAYGDDVLEDLDEERMGERNLVATLFGAVTTAIGSNFVPEKEVDRVLGNGQTGEAGTASSA